MEVADLSRAEWRRSTYSGSNGNCVEVAVAWRTSSHSSGNGACVEVAASAAARMLVRDTEDREGPVLALGPDAWRRFARKVKSAARVNAM